MILVLDVFGVVYQSGGLNDPLIDWVQTLRNTQDIKVVLASNMARAQANHFLHDMGLEDKFDDLFCSGAIGHAKPDRRFYNHVTGALGVPPQMILFFDDSGRNVTGAQAFGWRAYLYESVGQVKEIFAAEHAA